MHSDFFKFKNFEDCYFIIYEIRCFIDYYQNNYYYYCFAVNHVPITSLYGCFNKDNAY